LSFKNAALSIFFITVALSSLNDAKAADGALEDLTKYEIGTKDQLNIQVTGEKELSGIFTVSEDGDISYPLLGSVYVQSLTLSEIQEFLTNSLKKGYLLSPDVHVIFFAAPPKPVLAPETVKIEPTPIIYKTTPTPVVLPVVKTEAVGPPNSDADIIDVGDKLNIRVYKEPDLSGVFNVTASGKINYPILGEVYARSLSLDELKQFFFNKLNGTYVKNPQIEITIAESPTKSVSVLGQVTKPGNYILTHQLTILRLISQNGGFAPEAATSIVRIVRSHKDGKKETVKVNIDKVIQGEAEDVLLVPGDIIFVDSRSKGQGKNEVSKNYITLLGQVGRPGNYFFNPNLTLISLIGEAGGFTAVAATGRVKIIRRSSAGKKNSFTVDAGNIMNGGKDVEIEEGDLIIVPESYF